MTVAKYLRISNEDVDLKSAGKEESNSVSNQRNLLNSFLAQHSEFANASIVEFCDDGWSGKNFERPGVRAMLEEVKQGKIHCIVVKDLSRLGRDYLTVGNYISRIFPFMGVRFIAVNDGLDSTRPGDVDSLDTSFKSLLYDLYSRDLSRKVRSAKRFRAQRGDFVAPFAPYGYMKSPENHNQLVIDPPAAEVVRRIFRLMASSHSAMDIARMLNAEGVPTPMLHKRAAGCTRSRWPSVGETNFWTSNTVTKILRDKRYIGTNIYGRRVRDIVGSTHTVKARPEDWVVVTNTHEPLVSQEEFDWAQAAMREFKEHDGYADRNPLARKVRCGVCGHILAQSKGKSCTFFCSTARYLEDTICARIHISQDELRTAILESLRAQAAVALEQEEFVEKQRRKARQEAKSRQKQLAALLQSQDDMSRENRSLYESFALGDLDKADYLAKKAVVAEKMAEIAARVTELQSTLEAHDESNTREFIEKFKCFFEADDISAEILKDLLKEVRVYPGRRLVIEWNCQDTLLAVSNV